MKLCQLRLKSPQISGRKFPTPKTQELAFGSGGGRGALRPYGPNTGLPSFPWSAKRYISSRRLLKSHLGPQPALPKAARTLQTMLQTPQSQRPRTLPAPKFLCESQWPASPARSGSVAVVIVQRAAQALTANTQAALSPRFAGFQDSNPQSAAFS